MIKRKLFKILKCSCIVLTLYIFIVNFYLIVILKSYFEEKLELKQVERVGKSPTNLTKNQLKNPFLQPVNDQLIDYKMVEYENVGDTKHILFFTKLWYHKNWGLSAETMTKDSPELKDCPYTNCVFTNKRDYLNHTHEYDALIFHQTIGSW